MKSDATCKATMIVIFGLVAGKILHLAVLTNRQVEVNRVGFLTMASNYGSPVRTNPEDSLANPTSVVLTSSTVGFRDDNKLSLLTDEYLDALKEILAH